MTTKTIQSELTFGDVHAANFERCRRWHPGFPDDEDWSLADWCLAMVGEAGEAANVVKKIHRAKYGLRGRLDPPMQELIEALAEELADVFLYLDLLACKARIDLPAAIVAKFNAVSERQDFPERLAIT